MQPILFQVGAIELPSYLTLLMLGFFASVLVARRDGEAVGMDGVGIVDLGILMLLLGLFGARILAVLTDGVLMDFVHLCTDPRLVDPIDTSVRLCQQNSDCGYDYLCNLDARAAVVAGEQRSMCHPPTDCFAVLKFWHGGLTFYGGLLFALPGGWYFAKRKGWSAAGTADLFAAPLMLGLSFGRIGCFLNGCCYGAYTDSIAGLRFPGMYGDRHPTQLYESLFALLLFFVLRHGRPGTGREGARFAWMLVLYGIFRIAIEWLRDDPRGAVGLFSTSQLISIPLVLMSAIWLLRTTRRR